MSQNLSKNNHFEFESATQNNSRQFYVKLGAPQKAKTTPFQQSVKDAQHFYETSESKKVKLCLSGGIDSESMCRAFLKARFPFEVVFLRFKSDFNLYDINTNINFCKSKGIKFSYVDLDIIEFYESGKYFDVAKKYECQSPQIAAHLWFLDQIDGVPCMSGNPIAPIWQNDSWFFVGLPGELHSTYFKYFYISNREGIPWFFIYSPEMIKSFLNLDCMKPYLNRQMTQPSEYTYLEKCRSYFEGGFLVNPRQDKLTGFELVKSYYDQKCNTSYGKAFNDLFRVPLEKMFPFPDEYHQLIPKEYFDAL